MSKEKNTDIMVAKMLDDVQIRYKAEESGIKEIDEALKTASKRGTGKTGFPEFVAVSKEYPIVIENKRDTAAQVKYDESDNITHSTVCEDTKSITDYALNGAIHYARHIASNTTYKKVFAIGVSGDEKHHIIQPAFVDDKGYTILNNIETFENFSKDNIEQYYRTEILKETPLAQLELSEIISIAKDLHEDLRNYGQLSEQEKPLVVSAVLLALEDDNFSISSLIGNEVKTDGAKIYEALSNYLNTVKVTPDTKKKAILDQFSFISSRVKLNEKDDYLDKTPIRYFTETINEKVKSAIKVSSPEDILGRFYGEFVKYSGGDGKGLGIVLTPSHITELICELLDIKANDIVFDPCCGTAGFLISAMHHMIGNITDIDMIKTIKKHHIHGIEIREDLFSIATTNMILRGDGKSNLQRADFFTLGSKKDEFIKLQTDKEKDAYLEENKDLDNFLKINATIGMMNPPYSQAKGKETAHLSEINFILRLLDSLVEGGRAAVIIPQSTMVGKTNEDKKLKKVLLEKHSLEAVITLNKDTFYGVGVNPCIAIFTAHVPHNKNKRSKFINFEDDGYIVRKHIGLVATEKAKDRKKYLLDVYFDRIDAPSKFMVKSIIETTDEWLHSFYYFNDETPKKEDFINTMADYLTFEFNMISNGRGYLFEDGENDEIS